MNESYIINKILVPFAFLQAHFTTLLLERNTYNREDKIQEILQEMQESMEEINAVLSTKKPENNLIKE